MLSVPEAKKHAIFAKLKELKRQGEGKYISISNNFNYSEGARLGDVMKYSTHDLLLLKFQNTFQPLQMGH